MSLADGKPTFIEGLVALQQEMMTKEIDFQESLVKSFYLYMGFLAMNGFTPCGLFSLFFKKQRLNLWRQNTNY